jgi:hypothetical protein
VGPHDFKPIRIWDLWSKNGRCSACFLPKSEHPIHYWVRARPFHDYSEPDLEEGKNGEN